MLAVSVGEDERDACFCIAVCFSVEAMVGECLYRTRYVGVEDMSINVRDQDSSLKVTSRPKVGKKLNKPRFHPERTNRRSTQSRDNDEEKSKNPRIQDERFEKDADVQ